MSSVAATMSSASVFNLRENFLPEETLGRTKDNKKLTRKKISYWTTERPPEIKGNR